jgi:CMP-N,N'-diacetyllegionaminic acid synthase
MYIYMKKIFKKKPIEVVAIIPARSGSKGIKNKNIQKIKNKPLLAWAIEVCKKSKKIDYFFVLTDSSNYKMIAKKYGAFSPFERPKSISKDTSTDIEFVKYSIKKLSEINIYPKIIVNLRPTTPFRNYKIVDKAIKIFLKKMNEYSSLRSVEEMPETALKTLFVEEGVAKPIIKNYTMEDISKPRQNFQKTYSANGYLDIYKVDIVKKKSLYGNKVLAYETERTTEIDSPYDLKIARKLS